MAETFVRDGVAYLRNKAGTQFYQVKPGDVEKELAKGDVVPATADEVTRRDVEKRVEAQGVGGVAKAFAEGAVTSAIDVAALPATLPVKVAAAIEGQNDPTTGFSGRNVLETAFGEEYGKAARERAQVDPGYASTLGRVTGEILAGGPYSKALGAAAAVVGGASRLGRAAATAGAFGAEGAAYGAVQATEDAYVQDRELTAEQLLASMGTGAFIGGLVGLAPGAAQLFRRRGSRGSTPVDSPRLSERGAPYRTSDEALAEQASKIVDKPAPGFGAKLRDAFESVQSGVSGANVETIKKYGALRWDDAARRGRELWRDKDAILEGATRDLTSDVDSFVTRSNAIKRSMVDQEAKRELVAANLDKLDDAQRAQALESARAASGQLRQDVQRLSGRGQPDAVSALGLKNAEYMREGMRDLRTFREAFEGATPDEVRRIARGEMPPRGSSRPFEPVDVRVEPDGKVHLSDGRHRMMAAEEAGATEVLARVRRLDNAGNVIDETVQPVSINPVKRGRQDPFLRDLDEWLTGVDNAVQKGDAADAYVALDRAKRALQRKVDTAGSTVHRQTKPLKKERTLAMVQGLEEAQERVRLNLMDEGVWGAQGTAQRGANASWERYLRVSRNFDSRFTARMGREYGGFGGAPIRQVDPDKIASYVQQMGRQRGALNDQVFREYVAATEELVGSIGKGYGLSAAEQKTIAELGESAKRIRATLGKADETVRVANQIDEVIQAESVDTTSLGRGFVGNAIAGPLGAAASVLFGHVSRPGQLIRQAAAIQQLTKNFDGKLGRALGAFFERHSSAATTSQAKRLPGAVAKVARRAAVPTSVEAFRGKHDNLQKAYQARVSEVLKATADNGAQIRQRAVDSLGELPTHAPKLSQQLVLTATRAAELLKSKIPAGLVSPTIYQPSRRIPASKADILSFAKVWAAINNPLSALEDLRRGTLSLDQVEALRTIYPKLYQNIQDRTLRQIAERDLAGDPIPMRARMHLDILLGLNGAGEPTLSPDFAMRLNSLRAQQAEQKAQQPPPRKPPQIAKRLESGMQSLGSNKS